MVQPNVSTVIDNLEFLSQELIREQFHLQRIKRDQHMLEGKKAEIVAKIREIKRRADYDLDKHRKTLSSEE